MAGGCPVRRDETGTGRSQEQKARGKKERHGAQPRAKGTGGKKGTGRSQEEKARKKRKHGAQPRAKGTGRRQEQKARCVSPAAARLSGAHIVLILGCVLFSCLTNLLIFLSTEGFNRRRDAWPTADNLPLLQPTVSFRSTGSCREVLLRTWWRRETDSA
jgi:hypothetical protein